MLLRLPIISDYKAMAYFPFPSPWNEQGAGSVLTLLSPPWLQALIRVVCAWITALLVFISPTHVLSAELKSIYHWVTPEYHFSGTLCVTLHDFLVKREHDLGLADNTQLSVCICFFWTLARQLLQTPTASPSAGIGLACEFQVSFPMSELHGRRKTAVNCSYCLMLSLLKQQSAVRCRVFVWVVSAQEQNPPRP